MCLFMVQTQRPVWLFMVQPKKPMYLFMVQTQRPLWLFVVQPKKPILWMRFTHPYSPESTGKSRIKDARVALKFQVPTRARSPTLSATEQMPPYSRTVTPLISIIPIYYGWFITSVIRLVHGVRVFNLVVYDLSFSRLDLSHIPF